MHILTLETTCDETAAAIVTDRLEVLASVVASQDDLHRRFGGVVPEIASRAHLERILPVIDEALRRAGLSLADIDVVAVANTPGLAGSLLVGLVAAKTICVARQIPLVAVNHLQAHVYACRLAAGRDVFPCVGLIVSGGHSSLYRCRGPLDFEFLGGTIDDAAGEAFDKVATMLGLPYPGGPSIERAAATGNPRAYAFPRSLLREPRLEFSFSGLKTAVRYAIEGKPGKAEGEGGRRKGKIRSPKSENPRSIPLPLFRLPPPFFRFRSCRQLSGGRRRLFGGQGDGRARTNGHSNPLRRRRRGRQCSPATTACRGIRTAADRTAHRADATLHRQRRHGRALPSNDGRPGSSSRSISMSCRAS